MDREGRRQRAERRRLSRPRRKRRALATHRRTVRNEESSSVSIMFEIKGCLVLSAAPLFKSGPVSGREGGGLDQ